MDYFKQRRAYRNFKMYEASVSNGQNNLYRELLDYANDEGKLDVQFRMKNSALLSLTGLSEPGLDKARNSLVQLGLIKYVRGKKNVKPPEYRIINLYSRSAGYPTSNPTTNHKSRSTGLDEVGQPVGQGGCQPVEHKELTSTDPDLTDTDSYDDDAGVTREQVINDWTNLWGFPNGIARPEIDEWLEEFKPEVIAYAILVAGEHQIGSNACLKYVRAIVAGWKKRNITTLEQAKKAAANHDDRMKSERKPSGYSKPRRKEVTPKWMQKGASQVDSKPNSIDNQQDDMSDEDFLALMNSQEEAK
ncbi:DNA replication protein DnaD [Lactobacillus plantarum]|uniref:DnaD domain-containing protein n=1 Tax=Lactiplantibacillus plantarum TaxID=1590 RepID=UPI0006CB5245|nr:DnaD domain protein [Lactiplantibacillus plantarum]ALF14762.1 replication protein DnaD [Lactiplantibacillus plantarum]MCG0911431.1 prophage P2a protein 20, replication protein DnaD domain [Lactiplantibacillus plantarum]MDN7020949.1 DnaD domain protein [Lactiplantibacillus plantarum]MZV32565.1 DNA replication protein DnaD [Lactiplantibacillus plantarum]MZV52884.1 DNA replication protein DnaD [Lactiplantibacillus plantarum]